MNSPIIVGADGSDLDALAIEEAGLLAKRYERTIVVVFVRKAPALVDSVGSLFSVDSSCLREALDYCEVLIQARSAAILDALGVFWTFEVRSGRPAGELIRAGIENDATMIVIARRRYEQRRLHRYSVAGRLSARWPNSLLIMSPSTQHLYASDRRNEPCGDERYGLWLNRGSF
jgi:nucleotide-binding universal stress UspA family protein